ncbi:unnamed protein product [Pneumocystis jirovecii]|uniref:Mitochondrial import inner membrane translocase subunit TIM23 n=2 Tax=Pneumocystis jirovecii TaxID=42068 RepID=L0PG83_PNEJI|nr:protein transporter TIM23 [Pneumocystis jirovecii RU7]KTW31257.1 hypothetical protein T551_01329 [Pneumocystis jirovecii RU7]CCJ31371.1 unnamed protein product [Pneumocystis jirovecii]
MGWLFPGKKSSTEQLERVKDDALAKSPYSAPETIELYDQGVLDPSRLHPLAGLGKALDYLSLEDAQLANLPGGKTAFPSRGWSDDLTYGTGTVYVSALGIGGAWGFFEGLSKAKKNVSTRVRFNSILNAMTSRGPFLANSVGVIALGYNAANSTLGYYRGKHDDMNSIISGALAGTVYKSTRGIKSIVIFSGICSGMAGIWCLSKRLFI